MRTKGVRTSPIVVILLRERLLGLVLFLTIAAFIALQIDERLPAEGKEFLLLCAVMSSLGLATIIGAVYLLRLISVRGVHGRLSDILKLIDRGFCFRGVPEAAKLLGLTMIGDVVALSRYCPPLMTPEREKAVQHAIDVMGQKLPWGSRLAKIQA
jgi:hypothetical protein